MRGEMKGNLFIAIWDIKCAEEKRLLYLDVIRDRKLFNQQLR